MDQNQSVVHFDSSDLIVSVDLIHEVTQLSVPHNTLHL